MKLFDWPTAATLALDIGGWLLIHLGISYLCYRAPDSWFAARSQAAAEAKASDKSREQWLYERLLGIRYWKDRLPDGGELFRGGFVKKRLSARDPAYLVKFMLETRRGEWTHWLCIVPAPIFFLWNDPLYGWIMIGYALVANLPFIAVLRYNRMRLSRITGNFDRKE